MFLKLSTNITYWYNHTHFRDGKYKVQYVELWVSDKTKNQVHDCRVKLSWCALRTILKAREGGEGAERGEEWKKEKKTSLPRYLGFWRLRVLKDAVCTVKMWTEISSWSKSTSHDMVKFCPQLCFLAISIPWFNLKRSLFILCGMLSFPKKEIMVLSCWLRKGQNNVIKLLPGRVLVTCVLLTAL